MQASELVHINSPSDYDPHVLNVQPQFNKILSNAIFTVKPLKIHAILSQLFNKFE